MHEQDSHQDERPPGEQWITQGLANGVAPGCEGTEAEVVQAPYVALAQVGDRGVGDHAREHAMAQEDESKEGQSDRSAGTPRAP
jgi:hypothetical protein